MSTGNRGAIYDLGNGEYGLNLEKDRVPAFTRYGRVFLRVFTDPQCEHPKLDEATGKKLCTLKHNTEIRRIGFVD